MQQGTLLNEGKTKKIYEVVGDPNSVIVENADDITKHNDPSKTRKMRRKGEHSTTITSIFFQRLKDCGIPVAYQKRLSKNSFVAQKCKMIPLEVIARRYAYGSYLDRHPQFKREGKVPHRFTEPVFEVFLKTSNQVIRSKEGKKLFDTPVDDPMIANPESPTWDIVKPTMPAGYEGIFICEVPQSSILPEGVSIERIKEITRQTFIILEDMLSLLDLRLVDFKIEFGIGPNGELLLADVIDADSCRIRDENWDDISKESFRQNEDLTVVEKKYERLANMLEENFSAR